MTLFKTYSYLSKTFGGLGGLPVLDIMVHVVLPVFTYRDTQCGCSVTLLHFMSHGHRE